MPVVPDEQFNKQVIETVKAEMRRQRGGASQSTIQQFRSKTPYVRVVGYLTGDLAEATSSSAAFSSLPSANMDVYFPDQNGQLVKHTPSSPLQILNRYTDRSGTSGDYVEAEHKGGRWFAVELCVS